MQQRNDLKTDQGVPKRWMWIVCECLGGSIGWLGERKEHCARKLKTWVIIPHMPLSNSGEVPTGHELLRADLCLAHLYILALACLACKNCLFNWRMSFVSVVAKIVGSAIKQTKFKFHHLLLVTQLFSVSVSMAWKTRIRTSPPFSGMLLTCLPPRNPLLPIDTAEFQRRLTAFTLNMYIFFLFADRPSLAPKESALQRQTESPNARELCPMQSLWINVGQFWCMFPHGTEVQ